tara:strand:+ start:621 stop:761 length:141 start_codon:yes stop_codon:yes gene_type:complete
MIKKLLWFFFICFLITLLFSCTTNKKDSNIILKLGRTVITNGVDFK